MIEMERDGGLASWLTYEGEAGGGYYSNVGRLGMDQCIFSL
jgi:hypothetical protein